MEYYSISSTAIIGHTVGITIIHCRIMSYTFYPVIAHHLTFIMMTIDKLIGIKLP